MSHTCDIQLVCFDVGGVIIRICRTWAEGCTAAGVAIRHSRDHLLPLRQQWGELVRLHQIGALDLAGYVQHVSALTSNLYSPQEIEAIHHAWMTEEYHGVADLIDALHDAGLHTTALSNTNHAHWQRITGYPAVTRLGSLHASHELGLHKPDEKIFHELQRRTGFAGRQIIFFDDMLENIDGARAVGWHAELIDPTADTAAQMRAALIDHGINLHNGRAPGAVV